MLNEIFEKIALHGLKPQNRILCAVSGGIDSTVMLHVLNDYHFDCVVAHCNFQLRGSDSDDDERFVQALAARLEFKFVSKRFNTVEYAKATGLSIQMAARELRYDWFYHLLKELSCDYIALAHNADDQCETVITNLVRGTGIRGLRAMDFLKGSLFRPLIDVPRSDIERLAEFYSTDHVDDKTNSTLKYSRNKIRHCVLPLLEEINPACKSNILKSIRIFAETELILNDYIADMRAKCVTGSADRLVIDLVPMLQHKARNTILFELLVAVGIPKPLASEAINLFDAQTGKACNFLNYSILRDRNTLIVTKEAPKTTFAPQDINSLDDFNNVNIAAQLCNKTDVTMQKSHDFAYLDFGKIKFPLRYRFWVKGDKFKPFGMRNYKKISDFLKDEQVPAFDKHKVPLLESNGRIVWVVGHRIDDDFKIDDTTTSVLVLKL